MARRPDESIRIGWPRGVVNTEAPERLPVDALFEAVNLDVTRSGGVRRRPGYEQIAAGDFRSVWGCETHGYAVADDTLYYVSSDLVLTELLTGLNRFAPVAFGAMAGTVFWSDGSLGGRLIGDTLKPWGLPRPAPPQLQAMSAGALDPGRYQVCITGVDGEGREGPASTSASIDLPDGGAVNLVFPAMSPVLAALTVYITPADGDVFYKRYTVELPASGLLVSDTSAAAPLRTQYLDGPPKGRIIRHHAGRLYVAEGNTLWYSEPYAPHLFDRRQNFFQYPDDITVCEPVGDGLFVVADQTYFLSGTNPADTSQRIVATYGGVFGTSVQAEASDFPELGATGPVAIWTAMEGVCVGTPGGGVTNLTRGKVAMPRSGEGGAMIRRHDGVSQYVSTGAPGTDGFAATDRAELRIIRNGVVID